MEDFVTFKSLSELDDSRIDAVSSALFEAFRDDFKRMGVSKESARSFVSQSFQAHNGILSAWEGENLVATSGYSLSGDAYFVSNVWTSPDHRGKGVAKKMVEAAEDEIKSRGVFVARVWCDRSLSRMYESMGYSPETRDHRVSRNHVVDVLSKKLAPPS